MNSTQVVEKLRPTVQARPQIAIRLASDSSTTITGSIVHTQRLVKMIAHAHPALHKLLKDILEGVLPIMRIFMMCAMPFNVHLVLCALYAYPPSCW